MGLHVVDCRAGQRRHKTGERFEGVTSNSVQRGVSLLVQSLFTHHVAADLSCPRSLSLPSLPLLIFIFHFFFSYSFSIYLHTINLSLNETCDPFTILFVFNLLISPFAFLSYASSHKSFHASRTIDISGPRIIMTFYMVT